MDQQPRPRAVFSPEDFRLMRDALAHYLRTVPEAAESKKFANLYHRLGRID